jgi:hypothetical protein
VSVKPSPEYTRKMLSAFEESEGPTTDIRQLAKLGLPYETDEFIFHLRLLEDDGFVVRSDGRRGLGIDESADGTIQWSVISLRLTAAGHSFAEAMHSHRGFEAVKKSAVSTSLSIMRDIAVAAFKAEVSRHGLTLGS